ncbi:MAG: NERD domain-containing protein [Anaerolineae bacterium]|nr:NERD domain-containing protein [Anaerolineae bacterium]
MLLLDTRLTDLVRGYDRIAQADVRLQTEWRENLLRKYAQGRDRHTSALRQYLEKVGALKPQLSVMAYIPLAMLLGGALLVMLGVGLDARLGTGFILSLAGLALIAAGALGIGLPIALWLWQVKLAKPTPPEHPLHHDLLPRLMPQWRAKLHGTLPMPISQHRDASTRAFVEHLIDVPLDSMYVLAQLELERDARVDVVVLGIKGLWVFVVKDWSGKVSWRAGQWRYERFDARRNAWTHVDVSPPEVEYQAMAQRVSKTFAQRAPDVLQRFPTLARVSGGIVFTDANTTYDIPPTCPVRWGTMQTWSQAMVTAPVVNVDERSIFCLLDALLEQHHHITRPADTFSMSAYATKLVRQVEARVTEWMERK